MMPSPDDDARRRRRCGPPFPPARRPLPRPTFSWQKSLLCLFVGAALAFQIIAPGCPVDVAVLAPSNPALAVVRAPYYDPADAADAYYRRKRWDLIDHFSRIASRYESRLAAGLPLVEERRPRLAWANFDFGDAENRSHFRSHHPLYTLQTLWDGAADRHFQVHPLGERGKGGKLRKGAAREYDLDAARSMPDGSVIFVNNVWKRWQEEAFPDVIEASNLTLILFNGDAPFCDDEAEAVRLKSLPNVARIYATNACPHLKVVPLPLGIEDNLEFPRSSPSDWTFRGNELAVAKFFAKLLTKNSEKARTLFCDMTVETNPHKRRPARDFCRRQAAAREAGKAGVDVTLGALMGGGGERRGWAAYLTNLARHKFVMSPEGRGFDCHRTWEALLAGSVPIVQRNEAMGNGVWEGLPVLIVRKWDDVTPELLEREWAEFERKRAAGEYRWERLFAPYWIDRIRGDEGMSSSREAFG